MHGLVGGDEDEIPHAELIGQIDQALRAQHVVLDRFADVDFHHRHVLVRRGVEDHFGLEFLEDLPHAGEIGHVADAAMEDAGGMRRAQFPFDVENGILAVADQNHRLGIEAHDLPADFRADASARAGHHDDSPFQQIADDIRIQLHRIAAEEVVDFDVADGDAVVAVEEVFDGRNDFQMQAELMAFFHQLAHLRAGKNAGRHQDIGGAGGGDDGADVFQSAEDGNAPQPRAVMRLRPRWR